MLTLAASVIVGARVADAQDGVAAINPAPGIAVEAPAGVSVSGALLVDGAASPAHAATTLLYNYDPASRSVAADIANDDQAAEAVNSTGVVVVGSPTYRYDHPTNVVRTSARPVGYRLAPQAGEGQVRLVYEHNPKHGATTRFERGVEISRRPHGGQAEWQAILDASVPNGPRHRRGIEPDTGLTVELRLHLEQQLECETVRFYHGYVPGG